GRPGGLRPERRPRCGRDPGYAPGRVRSADRRHGSLLRWQRPRLRGARAQPRYARRLHGTRAAGGARRAPAGARAPAAGDGGAIHATGSPLPPETVEACKRADAVLLGAVGLPEFDGAAVRPEQGLIALRAELDVYANLRPARGDGLDLLIVRELIGGLYYGASGRRDDGSAFDTCEYHPSQIERLVRKGFELARTRRGHLTSVDKANVLETSRLW